MSMFGDVITPQFIRFAADFLGDTERGLSGAKIIEAMSAYAVEFDVNIPRAPLHLTRNALRFLSGGSPIRHHEM